MSTWIRSLPATLAVIVALGACGGAPPAPPPPTPAAASAVPLAIGPDHAGEQRIADDVGYLASPELQGRGTGEEGSRAAAQHLAKRFDALRLVPLGDGDGTGRSYLQHFPARVGVKTEPPVVSIKLGRKEQDVDPKDTIVAEGSASGAAQGDAVFVGHGVSAPALSWDEYSGADVEGKIVVVLDGPPGSATPGHEDRLRDFGGVRYKLRNAREHKAAGAVIVAAELPAAPAEPTSMGLPAVVVTRAAAKGLLPKEPAKPRQEAEKPALLPHTRISIRAVVTPLTADAFNVIGLLPAEEGSPHAREYVVVGAHFDHLGFGGTSASRAPGVHAVHPGADDNASGTAMMLEVARRLAGLSRRLSRGVLFVGFGAEELGALGSRWFVDHPPVAGASFAAMINADMVGRMREDHLTVDGVGTSAAWPALVRAASEGLHLDIAEGAEGFGASDHTSFTAARVPVAFLFTGVHDDYHLPSDTADKINAAGIERAATLASRMALALAERPDRIAFVDAPSDPHGGMRGGFRVSLGTIPDYAWQGKGVRLTGVRTDAPAARAGILAGDVIVKVGTHEITNIHDYVFALGELEPGRSVGLEIEREGKRIPFDVVPAPGR